MTITTVRQIPFDDWVSVSNFAEWLADQLEWGRLRLPIEVTGFNPKASQYLYRALRRRNMYVGVCRTSNSVVLRDNTTK